MSAQKFLLSDMAVIDSLGCHIRKSVIKCRQYDKSMLSISLTSISIFNFSKKSMSLIISVNLLPSAPKEQFLILSKHLVALPILSLILRFGYAFLSWFNWNISLLPILPESVRLEVCQLLMT